MIILVENLLIKANFIKVYSVIWADGIHFIRLFSTIMLANNTDLHFFRPCDLLLPYVRYYYRLKSSECFSALTFPLGCPQIIFHMRSPLFIPELNHQQSVFTISGQVNFPAHVYSNGNTEMFVAVFYPHAIGIFIDTPPSLFYNIEISGYDIDNEGLNKVASRIFDNDSNGQMCVKIIEHWLLAKLHDTYTPNFSRIGATVERLMKNPATSVTELAGIACFSNKQFERVFYNCVGMRPKEYSRIVRFQKSLWLMQNGHNGSIGISYLNGYSDQSHFIREFKTFSGYTPCRFIQEYHPYSDLFTRPV